MSGNAVSKFSDRLRRAISGGPDPSGEEERRPGMVAAVCVLASVLLWFTFSMRETYTRLIDVPLEVVNLAEGQALVGTTPTTARVQVEGEGIQLLRLYYRPPTIPVDASQDAVDLMTAAPEVFSWVRLDAVMPRMIQLSKDSRVSKRLPIRPRVAVLPPAGHHLVGVPSIMPDSVTVSGAGSLVEGLTYWPTRRLQVQPAGDSVSVSVPLSDTLSGLVQTSVRAAVYSASVREFTEGSRSVPIRVVGAPPGQEIQFDPPTILVVYQVALDQYDAAQRAPDFYAEVEYQAIRGDTTGSIVPRVHYPEGIQFREYRLEPPSVGYYFEMLFD